MGPKLRRFLTIPLALAFGLAGMQTAHAGGGGPQNPPVPISKSVCVPEHTPLPVGAGTSMTFDFAVTPDQVDPTGTGNSFEPYNGTNMPQLGDNGSGSAQITFTSFADGNTTNGIACYTAQSAGILDSALFSGPGLYQYTITEDPPAISLLPGEAAAYSQAQYTMELLVVPNGGSFPVLDVAITMTRDQDGTATSGKVDNLLFRNDFTRPGTLEVRKTVAPGSIGDTTQCFPFTMTVTTPDLPSVINPGTQYTATIFSPGGIPAQTVTFTSGAEASFCLGDGQFLQFPDGTGIAAALPIGTHYTVTEGATFGFQAEITVTTSGQANNLGVTQSTGDQHIGGGVNETAVLNGSNIVPPTGEDLSTGPFIILGIAVLGVLALLVAFAIRRRVRTNR